MSFARVNPAGWALDEVLTSAQMNSLDTNVSNALDKRVTGLDIDSRTGVARYTPFGTIASSNLTFQGTGYFETSATSQQTLTYPVIAPDGATITSVTVWYTGALGHAGLPAGMPTLSLRTVVLSTGAIAAIGTQSDTSGTTGALETYHAITLSGLSHVVERGTTVSFLRLLTESGANSVSGATISPVGLITMTLASIDPGS
jgi:hypothetical protein